MRFRNQTKIWYHPISISTNQLWTNWCSWWGKCVKCHFFQTEMLGCWHYHGTKPLRGGDVLINFPLIRIRELLQDPNLKDNCCHDFRCRHVWSILMLSFKVLPAPYLVPDNATAEKFQPLHPTDRGPWIWRKKISNLNNGKGWIFWVIYPPEIEI